MMNLNIFDKKDAKEQVEMDSYLSFKLDDEFFAVDVRQVIEILEVPSITRVPLAPDYMAGIINLRGKVLPLIDTKVKFGLDPVVKTINTCIIVIEITVEQEVIQIGALVDSVMEVLEIEKNSIQPSPSIEAKYPLEFIKGMYRKDEHFIMLVSLDAVFSLEEVQFMQDTNEAETK